MTKHSTIAPTTDNKSLEQKLDHDSEEALTHMVQSEEVVTHRVPNVKFVLVILSSRGMVYDIEALRQKILLSYPDAVVFFETTIGKPIRSAAPHRIDLLIDFTGPGQRQGFFKARKLRQMARVAVGRNAGYFRKKLYDRVFDEKVEAKNLPIEVLPLERVVQKKILEMAGVGFIQAGDTPPDRSKSIALELPGMLRL